MTKPDLESQASEGEKVVPLDKAKVGDLTSLDYSRYVYRVFNIKRDSSGKIISTTIIRRVFNSVKAILLDSDISSFTAHPLSTVYPEFDTFLQQYKTQQQTQQQGGEK